MDRLTSYENECKREMICRHEECLTDEEHCPHLNEDNCPFLQEILEKLAEYEDLEEQGKLLKLPVAVGDKVYSISDGKVLEWEVKELWDGTIWIDGTFIDCEDLGKTVYTSKADAEAALNGEENAGWQEHLSRRFYQVE